MALATIELLAGRSSYEKRGILEGVRRALVGALQIPEDDPVVRLVEHSPENVIIPPHHSEQYTIVEVTMFKGRTERTKRRLYKYLVAELGAFDIPAGDVQIVTHELPAENWSLGGIPATEANRDFTIEV